MKNKHLTARYLSAFKARDLIPLHCDLCNKSFKRRKNNVVYKGRSRKNIFCSRKCLALSKNKSKTLSCANCNKSVIKKQADIRKNKSSNVFCNKSCAATYNNTHKSYGIRVSKLEQWLKEQLTTLYPNLIILYNNKTIINSELDIYIPSFKLAFELNGIFHYEPIFGKKKLAQIKNNDDRKFQACLENNIELCIIDTSTHSYVTPKTSQKYLDIIINIISLKSK